MLSSARHSAGEPRMSNEQSHVYCRAIDYTSGVRAGSTHEAELIALSFCCDEGLWLRNLLIEAKFADGLNSPVPIMCDNQGTVFTAHNPVTNNNSKHIEVRYFRSGSTSMLGSSTFSFVVPTRTWPTSSPKAWPFRNSTNSATSS